MRGGEPHTGGRHAIDARSSAVRTAVASGGASAGALAGLLATRAVPPTADGASGIPLAAVVVVVAACAWVGGSACVAAAVDIECRRVPNRLVGGVLLAGAVASVALSWEGSDRSAAVHRSTGLVGDVAQGLALALAGCVLAGLPMLIVRLARRIGMGDVKLAGALGASLMARGWWVPLAAVAIAAAGAAAFGALAGRSAAPLAPFLAVGWWSATACVPMVAGFGQ